MGSFVALFVTAFTTDSTQNQMTVTACMGIDGLNWPRNSSRSTLYTTPGSSKAGAVRSVIELLRSGDRHDASQMRLRWAVGVAATSMLLFRC